VVVSKVWIVDDDLWQLTEPVLPRWPDKAPGPKPLPDRLCLQGMLSACADPATWPTLDTTCEVTDDVYGQ
jgi:hypothetical protein